MEDKNEPQRGTNYLSAKAAVHRKKTEGTKQIHGREWSLVNGVFGVGSVSQEERQIGMCEW